MSVDSLIEQREATHGSFEDNAGAFRRLEEACPLHRFDPKERYAVAAIYIKLARLASGRMERQHWEDIEGYARLMVQAIDGEKR